MIAICTVPVYCARGTKVHSTVSVQRSVAQRLRVNQVHHSLPCTNQVPRTLLKVGSISICHCQSLIDDRILGSNSKHFNILLSVSHPVPTNFSRLLNRRGAPSITFRNFLEYFRKYQTSIAWLTFKRKWKIWNFLLTLGVKLIVICNLPRKFQAQCVLIWLIHCGDRTRGESDQGWYN